MDYTEIAKYFNFISYKSLFKRISVIEKRSKEDEFQEELSGYDIKPVIIEMHKNFGENWHSERAIKKIEEDYEEYISKFEEYLTPFSSGERSVLGWQRLQLRNQFHSKTFLDPRWIPFRSKDDEKERQPETEDAPIWLKVGTKLATGEINKSSLKDNSAPKIAKVLDLPLGSDKYILGTINNYQKEGNKDKNIYASKEKMQAIADYCRETNLPIIDDFKMKLDSISDDF